VHKVILLLLVALSAFDASAQSTTPPASIFGLYSERVPVCFNTLKDSKPAIECEGQTANWLLVVPTANDGVWVEVNLLFHHGHTCQFQGNGEWKGDHVLVEKHDTEACELRVHFKSGKAMLSDDGRCRAISCGARGGYDGMSLPKRGAM
jgi:hypothetical protein